MAEYLSLAEQAAQLREEYAAMEARLLARISDRLAAGISTPGWTEAKYAEVTAMAREMDRALSAAFSAQEATIRDLLTQAYVRGATDAGIQIGASGELLGKLTSTHVAGLEALYSQTMGDFSQARGVILRSTLDAYRSVVADVTGQVVAGGATRLQATQDALDRLAGKGITSFTDRAGRAWTMDSYAEMAVRTATTRAHLEGKLATYREAGIDLYVISRSGNPCEDCDAWEDEVVSDGPSPDYPTIDEAEADGLFHPNCGHTLDAFTPGTEDILGIDPKFSTADGELSHALPMDPEAGMRAAASRDIRPARAGDVSPNRGEPDIGYAERFRDFKKAKTLEDARARFDTMMPGADISDLFEGRFRQVPTWDGAANKLVMKQTEVHMPLSMVNEVLRAYETVARDFPEAIRTVPSIHINITASVKTAAEQAVAESKVYAQVWTGGNWAVDLRVNAMELSPYWFLKEADELARQLRTVDFKMNWHNDPTAAGIITHELGHVVERWMATAKYKGFITDSTGKIARQGTAQVGQLGLGPAITKYGATNTVENFAEGFTRMYAESSATWDKVTRGIWTFFKGTTAKLEAEAKVVVAEAKKVIPPVKPPVGLGGTWAETYSGLFKEYNNLASKISRDARAGIDTSALRIQRQTTLERLNDARAKMTAEVELKAATSRYNILSTKISKDGRAGIDTTAARAERELAKAAIAAAKKVLGQPVSSASLVLTEKLVAVRAVAATGADELQRFTITRDGLTVGEVAQVTSRMPGAGSGSYKHWVSRVGNRTVATGSKTKQAAMDRVGDALGRG